VSIMIVEEGVRDKHEYGKKKKGDTMRKVWKFLQGDEIWENKE
jgi:hypothetical protein